MIPYGNKHGDSGVVAYDIGTDRIAVRFVDGRVYVYSNKSAGKKHIEQMKQLAKAGRGLSTYISQYVKDGYEQE